MNILINLIKRKWFVYFWERISERDDKILADGYIPGEVFDTRHTRKFFWLSCFASVTPGAMFRT